LINCGVSKFLKLETIENIFRTFSSIFKMRYCQWEKMFANQIRSILFSSFY